MPGIKGRSGRKEGNPGNKGGRGYNKKNREKADVLKGLVMDWAIKVMQKPAKTKDEKIDQRLVISKILVNCVPRPVELTGEDGNPIPILNLIDKNIEPIEKEE